MKYSKILFDLDGTLTESGPGITHAVQYALHQMGIEEPNRSQLECFVGPPLNVSFREYYGMNEQQSAEAIHHFREVYDREMIYENEVYPGVPKLLKTLHEQGVHLAIASSKPENMVHKVLEYFGLKSFFDVIVGSSISEELDNKMGTDNKLLMVQKALRELGVLQSAEGVPIMDCAMVGDRSFDIKGARANHVTAVGVTYGYGSRQELEEAGAEYIADDVRQLQEILCGSNLCGSNLCESNLCESNPYESGAEG